MTDSTLYRSCAPDLELRASGDGRTVHGIAVPWGRPQRIDATLTEQFARGAFRQQMRAAERVQFARDHIPLGGKLIGRLDVMRDDAAGLYVEARVAKTALGDETLALIEDGALRDLSIGFRPRQDRRLRDGTIERASAQLREVAVVGEGAYGDGATIAGLRAAADDADDDLVAGLPLIGCACRGAGEDTHQPPAGVKSNAARALSLISDGKAGEGFTDTGRRRAQQLASGDPVGTDTVRAMAAYFARHGEGDQGKQHEEGTPAHVAWLAWGGDAGKSWAESTVAKLDGSRSKLDEARQLVAGMPALPL